MKLIVKRIPDELKRQVVKEYLTTNATREELSIKYGFGNGGTLGRWIRIFGGEIKDKPEPTLLRAMTQESKKSKSTSEQEARIQQLERELAYKNLKIEALNTMIDIAEDQFNIPIRKKAGSKR